MDFLVRAVGNLRAFVNSGTLNGELLTIHAYLNVSFNRGKEKLNFH